MKKSVRVFAAVLGVCMLCGCTAKETKTTRMTKEETTASESDTTETTTESTLESTEASSESTSEVKESTTESTSESASDTTEDTTEETTADTSASEETSDSSAENGDSSMKDYKDFLNGKAKVDISFLQEKKDSLYFLNMEDDTDFPDRALKRDEFFAFLKTHTWRTSPEGSGSKESYTLIDCGQDGEMELIYQVEGLGDFRPQFVIKSVDGQLKLTSILESWSRNDAFVNAAGFLTSSGAGGAALHYTEYGYLDENGETVIVASVSSQFGNFDIINPEFAKMEEYCSNHDLTSDYYIDEVKFGADSTPLYTLLNAQDKELDPELKKLFDETSVQKIGYEEYISKIKEKVGEKRYNAPSVTWTELN